MKSISLYTLAAVLTALPPSSLAAAAHSSSDLLASAHHRRFHHKHSTTTSQQQQQQHDTPVQDAPTSDVTALAVRDSDASHPQLVKRGGYNGRATFFDPGLGACGTYSSSSDFMVAMNEAQYGDLGAVSPWCFQTISISYGGKTAQAQVLDACPGCPYGGLDMSPSLFKYFADESVGVIYVSWNGGGGGDEQKTTVKTTTTTTTQWVPPTTTTTQWTPPPTTYKPTTTWEPTTTTTTTTTWSPPPSSSSKSSSTTTTTTTTTSSTTTNSTTTTSESTNSTLASSSGSSSSSSTSASSSAISAGASASTTSFEIGGNLDGISQLVIAMGNVAGAAVANPNNV
ncbi:hypothetical protein JCM11491_004309 [Sporobolomyces phaffii]